MPMTQTRISLSDFVVEMKALIDQGSYQEKLHRFLLETRIEDACLEPCIRFEPGKYTRHLVFKSPEVEVLILCWDRGQMAPVHGHEGELCWARVERGRLRFRNYREIQSDPLVIEPVGEAVDGGEGHLDGPADIHSVENPVDFGGPAVSLHVYSKPYDQCDIYDVKLGKKRRVQLRYDSVGDRVALPE